MLVVNLSGAARLLAHAHQLTFSWSSASLSTLFSIAYIPAAAMTPACRMPPPQAFLCLRARYMSSSEPTSTEPTGEPRPLERHMDTEEAFSQRSLGVVSRATQALNILAPSM